MAKCNYCGIRIIDETDHCPFCKSVLNKNDSENITDINSVGGYPNIGGKFRLFRFLANLILFLSIIAAVVCVTVNGQVSPDFWWSVIVVLGLLYVNMILQYAVMGKSGYRYKIVLLTLMALGVLTGIDAVTGYYAWSVNYVLPSAIILLDLVIIFLMIFNRNNWQSYIMSQILMIVFSICAMILFWVGIITSPYMVQISLGVSVLLFVGTVILGDRRAKSELRRRFHI